MTTAAFAFSCLVAVTTAVLPGQDYGHEVLARTGTTLTNIGSYVSINNAGVVAFPGSDATGSRTFVVETPGTIVPVTFAGSATRNFDGAAINNQSPAVVATRDRASGTSPTWLVRKWAVGGAATVIGRSPTHFDSSTAFVDVNDRGDVVFTGLIGGSSQLAIFAGGSEPPTQVAVYPFTATLRPQIANDGRIVVRDPQRILIWEYPGVGTEFIAGASLGFTVMGDAPGISADGRAVAFIGDRGQGKGVFVSVQTATGRSIFRVAGEGTDAFTDFEVSQRVGVASDGRVEGGQVMTTVFMATRGGVRGIFTVDVSAWDNGATIEAFAAAPLSVANIGDTIGGITVTTLLVYDPINACGVVAFRAGDATQGVVVRSTRTVVTAKISIKRVLGPRGLPNALWTLPTIQAWVDDASSVFRGRVGVAFQISEIVDISDPHLPNTWFAPAAGNLQAMERAAETDPCRYRWRTDAINVYLTGTIVGAGGVCSFPHGSGPFDNDMILVQPSILNGSLGLAHELGHYFNLRHTHANHEGPAGGCPGGSTHGDCVNDTRHDADRGLCTPFTTVCHNANLTLLANANGYTAEELRVVRFNLMSYHGPITVNDVVLSCGQARRAVDAVRRLRGHVLLGARVPTITGVAPGNAVYPGPTTLTVSGTDLPNSGVVAVGVGRQTSSGTTFATNQVIATYAQPIEPGAHCVSITQDQHLRAFREVGLGVTPSLQATVAGSPPFLGLAVTSSAPGQAMALFLGAPIPPLSLPGFLFQIEALPTVTLPFSTDLNRRIAFGFTLAGLPSGAAGLAFQTVELTSPSFRLSNAIVVYVP